MYSNSIETCKKYIKQAENPGVSYRVKDIDQQLAKLSSLLNCENPEQRAIEVCSELVLDEGKVAELLAKGTKGNKPTKTDFLKIYKTLYKPSEQEETTEASVEQERPSSSSTDVKSRLEALAELLQNGLVTEKEYEDKRGEILRDL